MPTENNPVPFKREERYITLKLNRLAKDEAEYLRGCQSKAMVECVVVESDWPEYHLVWLMLEHRMAGKPVPDFNAVRHADSLQQRLTIAEQRNAELRQEIAALHAINEIPDENVLWDVLNATVGIITRRAYPHALESEAHNAGAKVILDRRAGLAATHLKPTESGASHE